MLLQGEPGHRHPVAYISRKLFPREVRYSTVEKEWLAVKWALDAFRYYLLGREFLLETDHRPLQWMNRMRDSNARITSWYLSMQPYQFSISHVPGRDNTMETSSPNPAGVRPEVGGCVPGCVTVQRTAQERCRRETRVGGVYDGPEDRTGEVPA